MKEEKEIHVNFAVAPQTAKVMATMLDKCLVKMEKAFNSWVEDMNRKRIPTDNNVLRLYEDFSNEKK